MAAEVTERPTLLLLPGQLCDQRLFAGQVRGLAGLSDLRVGDLSRDETIPAMAERVLAAAPERFALGGVSLGGYVAFEILRRAPDRVVALAIMNSSARPDTPEQTEHRRMTLRAARLGAFRGVTPRLLPTILHPDNVASVGGLVMDMAIGLGRPVFERQQAAIMARADSRPLLPAIGCPTLVVGGVADRLTPPPMQQEIAAAIPGARLEILDGCGHLAPLEQPERVHALIKALLGLA